LRFCLPKYPGDGKRTNLIRSKKMDIPSFFYCPQGSHKVQGFGSALVGQKKISNTQEHAYIKDES